MHHALGIFVSSSCPRPLPRGFPRWNHGLLRLSAGFGAAGAQCIPHWDQSLLASLILLPPYRTNNRRRDRQPRNAAENHREQVPRDRHLGQLERHGLGVPSPNSNKNFLKSVLVLVPVNEQFLQRHNRWFADAS